MGCVTSKHLKEQAISDGQISPPSRNMPKPKTLASGYSVECYHRRFVALTSTSHASLKVESPKHVQNPTTTLTDMYGRLRSLDYVHSDHRSSPPAEHGEHLVSNSAMVIVAAAAHGNINNYSSHAAEPIDTSTWNSRNNTFTQSPVPKSPPMALEPISAELGFSETINVKEMMMGLEEAAPLSHNSSPVKRAHSKASTPEKKLHLKRKADGSLKSIPLCRFNQRVGDTLTEWNEEDYGFGKENTSFHSQHIKKAPSKRTTSSTSPMRMRNLPLSHNLNPSGKSTTPTRDTCSSVLPSHSPHQATTKKARGVQPLRQELIAPRKAAFESCTNSQDAKYSPGLSSASTVARSVYYAPSNGKVRLTLHAHQDDSASSVQMPSPLPVKRLMPRKPAFGHGGVISNELTITSPRFEPELVASYEKALSDVSQAEWDANHEDSPQGSYLSSAETCITNIGRPWLWSTLLMPRAGLDKRLYDPLDYFEENCPPRGVNAVVVYTTTLRGIRKTFEDCNAAREILQGFDLSIDERDVSMHLEFLNELRELMGRVIAVPRLFIKGRYIGGIEEIVKLHESRKLDELVEGLPKKRNRGSCDGCGGVRFVPCLECSGSCKLRREEDDAIVRCPDCNENGLIQCPICT